MVVLVQIAGPVAALLAVTWLSRPALTTRLANQVRAVAVGGAAAQLGFLLFAWLLVALMPREPNRGGGTCASYRSGNLDEAVVLLGWSSALVGGETLGASLAAKRNSSSRRWWVVAVAAVAIPYAIFIAYVWVGLCYALDT